MTAASGRLEVTGLAKSFQAVRAIDGIDLTVGRAELVGLIGPNGSGKTTLVNAITGIVRPDQGTVSCDGYEWQWLPAHRLAARGISRTFQNIRLFGRLTVFENVGVAAAAAGVRRWRQATAHLLRSLELHQYATRPVSTLAYGLQRRTELARALAGRPRYVFLDEPAAGLNDVESGELGRTLLGVRERHGCGIVLIEHDVPLVMSVCDRMVALNEGRVIASGPPAAVREDPGVKRSYLG